MISYDIIWCHMTLYATTLEKWNMFCLQNQLLTKEMHKKSSAIFAFSRSFVDSETFFPKIGNTLTKSCKKSKKMTDFSWMRHYKDQIEIWGYQSSSFFQLIADPVSEIYITRPNGELWRIWIFQKILFFFSDFSLLGGPMQHLMRVRSARSVILPWVSQRWSGPNAA